MADTSYATVADLKARISVPATDTAKDALLQQLLNDAAEAVDARTRGYRPPTATVTYEAFSATASETRLFDDDLSGVVRIDDCLSVTAVTRNGAAVDSDHYRLGPDYNQAPYTEISFRIDVTMPMIVTSAWYDYPRPRLGLGQVAITGTWGYCAAAHRPAAIAEATLLLAEAAYEGLGAKLSDKMAALRNVDSDLDKLVDARLRRFKRGGGLRVG